MNIITKVLVVCSIALFFATADCWAFRCGSGLVTTGDTKTQVLVTCWKSLVKIASNHNDRQIRSNQKV